jgi:hypothetical protein
MVWGERGTGGKGGEKGEREGEKEGGEVRGWVGGLARLYCYNTILAIAVGV